MPLEVVHVNQYGLIPVTCVGEKKYSTICTEDWFHWKDVSFFIMKSDTVRTFLLFKARAQRFNQKRGYKLMIVQRDRGELTFNNFMQQLALKDV